MSKNLVSPVARSSFPYRESARKKRHDFHRFLNDEDAMPRKTRNAQLPYHAQHDEDEFSIYI